MKNVLRLILKDLPNNLLTIHYSSYNLQKCNLWLPEDAL